MKSNFKKPGHWQEEECESASEAGMLSAFPGFYLLASEPPSVFCSTGFCFKLALNETELKYDGFAFR